MKYQFVMASIAVLAAFPATSQIYRCEVDGVASFSDLPCGPDSVPYTSGNGVSFITPDENLPALAESAQAFIRERREQLSRRERSGRQATASAPALRAPAETIYVPWPVIGHAGHEERFRRKDKPPPDIADNARYSPLTGPILGTRRDSWLFERERPRGRGENRK